MLDSKQRANLMAVAGQLKPIFQIGKEGVSDAQMQGMAQALAKRELIKITVLKNSGLAPRELLTQLAEKLKAQPVRAIGSKIILYKYSDDKSVKHIEF